MRNKNYMRFILFLAIIFLSSCETKKETILNKQQAIKEEMEQVKKIYYKKQDSLESVKQADTNSAKRLVIAVDLVAADREKSVTLIKFQHEYDSLGVEIEKK